MHSCVNVVLLIFMAASMVMTSSSSSGGGGAHAFSAAVPTTKSSSNASIQIMEETVRRYFQGVNEKDPDMIRSCFAEEATIRDVCGTNDSPRTVKAQDLVDRCMDFVKAHPDCQVKFHYGPECGRDSHWVVAHWYETGTWSGESCGLVPTNQPMAVEGQTRFLVNPDTNVITDLVVTRTFADWEIAFMEQQQQQQNKKKALDN